MYLENHLVGNKYYPMTVEPLVTPILTEAKKRVWQGVQKVGVYWGIGGMMGNFANDQDGLEVELGVPVRPEQNRNQRVRAVGGMMGGARLGGAVTIKTAPAVITNIEGRTTVVDTVRQPVGKAKAKGKPAAKTQEKKADQPKE